MRGITLATTNVATGQRERCLQADCELGPVQHVALRCTGNACLCSVARRIGRTARLSSQEILCSMRARYIVCSAALSCAGDSRVPAHLLAYVRPCNDSARPSPGPPQPGPVWTRSFGYIRVLYVWGRLAEHRLRAVTRCTTDTRSRLRLGHLPVSEIRKHRASRGRIFRGRPAALERNASAFTHAIGDRFPCDHATHCMQLQYVRAPKALPAVLCSSALASYSSAVPLKTRSAGPVM